MTDQLSKPRCHPAVRMSVARLDQHALGVLQEAEASERQLLRSLAIRGAS